MSILNLFKGWIGESMGSLAHRAFLDSSIYTSMNNLTLRTFNGTTQIDHVIVSKFGIFVVEAKNIDGWIFGEAKAPQWSVVKPGRKYRIQNPLHQNYRHVCALRDFLKVDESKLHSVVMFWGDCEFKTPMPPNVISTGYTTHIKSFGKVVFTDQEVRCAVDALRTGSLPKTWATRTAHLASLDARHSSTTTCPKCGSALVLRTAKTGPRMGSKFFGCSAYPKCRHTAPYSATS